jgi:hypothetical protein
MPVLERPELVRIPRAVSMAVQGPSGVGMETVRALSSLIRMERRVVSGSSVSGSAVVSGGCVVVIVGCNIDCCIECACERVESGPGFDASPMRSPPCMCLGRLWMCGGGGGGEGSRGVGVWLSSRGREEICVWGGWGAGGCSDCCGCGWKGRDVG